jgi:hypothetical protein
MEIAMAQSIWYAEMGFDSAHVRSHDFFYLNLAYGSLRLVQNSGFTILKLTAGVHTMTEQETVDLMIKVSAIAGAVYLIYIFIKDRYGKK